MAEDPDPFATGGEMAANTMELWDQLGISNDVQLAIGFHVIATILAAQASARGFNPNSRMKVATDLLCQMVDELYKQIKEHVT